VHSNESKTVELTGVKQNTRSGEISMSFFRIPSPKTPAAVRGARKRVTHIESNNLKALFFLKKKEGSRPFLLINN
jgi:hypothetical protein